MRLTHRKLEILLQLNSAILFMFTKKILLCLVRLTPGELYIGLQLYSPILWTPSIDGMSVPVLHCCCDCSNNVHGGTASLKVSRLCMYATKASNHYRGGVLAQGMSCEGEEEVWCRDQDH